MSPSARHVAAGAQPARSHRFALIGMVAAIALASLLSAPASFAQTPKTYLDVKYEIQLQQHYTVYGYLTDKMQVEVNGSFAPQAVATIVSVAFPFSFSSITGLPPGGNYTLQSTNIAGTSYTELQVTIPGGTDTFDFTVNGKLVGLSSLFFRDIAEIPPVQVSMSAPPFSPTSLNILIPEYSTMQIRAIYPSNGTQSINVAGEPYLLLDPAVVSAKNCQFCSPGISLVYQSTYSNYYAFLAIGLIVAIVLTISSVWGRLRATVARLWGKVPGKTLPVFQVLARKRGAKTLLVVLVVVCLVMVGISTVFGPPPVPRAYLSATAPTVQVLSPYVKQAGWGYLDYGAAADGFSRASGFGTFSAAIIADYQPSIVGPSPFQEGLDYVPTIILVSSYVPSSYISQVEAIHPYNTIVVNNPSELVSALARVPARHNVLGLTLSTGLYNRAAAIVGVLSLIVPFLALAFLASFAVELGGFGISKVFELVGYAVMAYFIVEFAFILSTVMLGMPVALHAAISHKETAEGLLGPFGGGTKPRELSGVLGFVFGVVYNKKGFLSYDKNVVIAVGAALAFIIADPLNVATSLYEVFLTVASSTGAGVSGPAYQFLRNLIGEPVGLFQSYITSDFVASHGTTLFFGAAVPMILYPRMGKSTGTLLLLFGAVGCGIGFIRVADMVPMETIASIAPGAVFGALLLPVFFGLNLAESHIRERI